jgi:hypothetical protein
MWLLFQAPDGVLQCVPEGFTIRRAFNINLRKGFQVGGLAAIGGRIVNGCCYTPCAVVLG